MTRENKLALVIGFALILFVGILVSDHFSNSQDRRPANLQRPPAVDPLALQTDDRELIDLLSSEEAGSGSDRLPAVAMNRIPAETDAPAPPQRENGPASPPEVVHVEMGGTVPPATVGLDPEEARQLAVRFHSVRKDETLTAICRQYYGDATLVSELAAYNDLRDSDHLTIGHRIRIPNVSELVRGSGRAAPAGPRIAEPKPAPAFRYYKVRKGDTLSEISQRELGTARKWRLLLELNREAIDDADHVPAGTVLKIPVGN